MLYAVIYTSWIQITAIRLLPILLMNFPAGNVTTQRLAEKRGRRIQAASDATADVKNVISCKNHHGAGYASWRFCLYGISIVEKAAFLPYTYLKDIFNKGIDYEKSNCKNVYVKGCCNH